MSNGACELVQGDRESSQIHPEASGCPGPVASPGATTSSDGVSSLSRAEMRGKILALEAAMKAMPERQIDIPTFHHFAPGVYMREIHIPKGATLTGKIHKTEHLNILSKGKLNLATEDGVRIVDASMVVKSTPGVKRAATALEDSVWITVHPNVENERDVDQLEARLVTDTYEQFLESMEGERQCLSSQ